MKRKGTAPLGTPSKLPAPDETFVETPQGIFTVSGVWFETTRAALLEFAGPVFRCESLESLIRRSEVWVRSPETLAVWMLPLAMLWMAPALAAAAVLGLFILWKIVSPSAVSRVAERIFAVLEAVWLQGVFYVGVLSYFAALEQYGAVVIGLIGFVLIRWQILTRITKPLLRRTFRSLYGLPVPDQILRAFVYRTAITNGIPMPEIDRMERRVADLMRRER